MGFRNLRQVGGRFAKAFGQSAIATAIHTVTRHARDFVLGDSKMRIIRKHGTGQTDIDHYNKQQTNSRSAPGLHRTLKFDILGSARLLSEDRVLLA